MTSEQNRVSSALNDDSTMQGNKLSASPKKTDKVIESYKSPYYRYLVLGILTTVYVSNFVDRQVINVLAQYIIDDLQISDGQFGMLSGLAFAFIYTTLSIPIARWADISNRRNIIAISAAIWSVMTALCGLAQNFAQLFLARFGVGIGEAGGSPPSHSIVSDIFPAEQRATALSIWSVIWRSTVSGEAPSKVTETLITGWSTFGSSRISIALKAARPATTISRLITMVSTGDGPVGASKLTEEVRMNT